MQKRNSAGKAGNHEHPLRHEISNTERKKAAAAHDQADRDMEEDVDLSLHSPNDDLDEGESARLGDKTDLI